MTLQERAETYSNTANLWVAGNKRVMDAIIAAYIAGAGSPSKGMEGWVKVFDGFPKMEKVVYLKDSNGTMNLGNFYEEGGCYMCHFQKNGAHEEYDTVVHKFTDLFWLDETPVSDYPSVSVEHEKRIAELEDCLKAINNLPFESWDWKDQRVRVHAMIRKVLSPSPASTDKVGLGKYTGLHTPAINFLLNERELQSKGMREVLQELVDLKGMKDKIDENFYNPDVIILIKKEYSKRKPLAWEKARKLLKEKT